MRCPFCGHIEDKVVDSRESREGDAIRRRRECLKCGRRFTSYERLEEVPILIVKKDGRREPFDRQKLLRGIMSACQKRPVSLGTLEEAAGDIQARLMELPDREVPSRQPGGAGHGRASSRSIPWPTCGSPASTGISRTCPIS